MCQLIVCQKTQILNVIRGLLRAFGHVIGNGPIAAMRFVKACRADAYPDIHDLVKSVPRTIPGVGPITASAIVATIGDGKKFKNGRELATWLGLTPLNKSNGGKERLGGISKKGERYIRQLLVIGATSQVQRARGYPERIHRRIMQLFGRKPVRLATVAMANKTARIIWAIPTKETYYRQSAA